MYNPDVDPVLDVLTIHYVVPHCPSKIEDASPFQLISPGIVETTGAFHLIASLPRDVTELIQNSDHIVATRIAGRGLAVLPIQTDILGIVLPELSTRIAVVISVTDEIAAAVNTIIPRCTGPILHVTRLAPALNRPVLRDHCMSVAEHWKSRPGFGKIAKAIENDLSDWKDRLSSTKLNFKDRGHLLTAPNIAVLASAGYIPEPWDGQPLVGHNNKPYLKALRDSIEPIVRIRSRIINKHPALRPCSGTDLILTVPGVIKTWHHLPRGKSLSDDPEEDKLLKTALRQIAARDTYNFSLPSPSGAQPGELMSSNRLEGMLRTNREDLGVYAAILSIRAASNFAPVVRLPPSANAAQTELARLAAARRADSGQAPHKLNRLAKALSDRLARGIPEWIIQHLRDAQRIKLISDAPLEWMSVDGFPLMLRADVSRIPVTPGNLFVQQALRCTEVAIPNGEFQSILIVRSFDASDPVRPMLEFAMNFYAVGSDRFPDVKIVDVRTRDDLIRALNEFQGAILVYDGHGAHPKVSDVGELTLVDERVDPWILRGVARIPPIVILAACDTHPFDASHATSANGFLAAGAVTVLGTSVPVRGPESAMMVARLLLRVGEYLPHLIEARPWKSFRWSEVLPGLQRRQYTSDALQRLSRVGGLRVTKAQMLDTMMDVGMSIDTRGDWLTLLVDRVAQIAGSTPQAARERLLKQAAFVEALAYMQLGNPELIVGYADGSRSPLANSAPIAN